MADTIIATANEVKQWDNDAFLEYVRENEMSPYMGTDENAAIQVDENLTKKPGDAITLSDAFVVATASPPLPKEGGDLVGTGSKYWTGDRPQGTDGEPFSDWGIDKGCIQSKHSVHHPDNL